MNEVNSSEQASEVIEVSRNQLPLSCPNAGTNPAELHPRVFIPLKRPGDEAVCPYCGANYKLHE